jgi:catechol 2,3-dioxygenase-like lactoylglutathione lyase family enzyme
VHRGGTAIIEEVHVLRTADVVAFVPTRDPKRARDFYERVLGLTFVSADPFALVFDANGVTIRVADVSTVKDFRPASFTILGWHVSNVDSAVRDLVAKGVVFERYLGLDQSPSGVWSSPSGAKVAWFKDPDGNVLSVTEY